MKRDSILLGLLLSLLIIAVACSPPSGRTRSEESVDSVSSALSTTYQAEDMFFSGFGEVRTSPAPTHRYFWMDGYISQNHNFAPGTTRIRVRASGSETLVFETPL